MINIELACEIFLVTPVSASRDLWCLPFTGFNFPCANVFTSVNAQGKDLFIFRSLHMCIFSGLEHLWEVALKIHQKKSLLPDFPLICSSHIRVSWSSSLKRLKNAILCKDASRTRRIQTRRTTNSSNQTCQIMNSSNCNLTSTLQVPGVGEPDPRVRLGLTSSYCSTISFVRQVSSFSKIVCSMSLFVWQFVRSTSSFVQWDRSFNEFVCLTSS